MPTSPPLLCSPRATCSLHLQHAPRTGLVGWAEEAHAGDVYRSGETPVEPVCYLLLSGGVEEHEGAVSDVREDEVMAKDAWLM